MHSNLYFPQWKQVRPFLENTELPRDEDDNCAATILGEKPTLSEELTHSLNDSDVGLKQKVIKENSVDKNVMYLKTLADKKRKEKDKELQNVKRQENMRRKLKQSVLLRAKTTREEGLLRVQQQVPIVIEELQPESSDTVKDEQQVKAERKLRAKALKEKQQVRTTSLKFFYFCVLRKCCSVCWINSKQIKKRNWKKRSRSKTQRINSNRKFVRRL